MRNKERLVIKFTNGSYFEMGSKEWDSCQNDEHNLCVYKEQDLVLVAPLSNLFYFTFINEEKKDG